MGYEVVKFLFEVLCFWAVWKCLDFLVRKIYAIYMERKEEKENVVQMKLLDDVEEKPLSDTGTEGKI